MKRKTITKTGIQIKGTAIINLWGGGKYRITMNESYIPNVNISKENILRCINDGQFGCESIESADVCIYDVYDHGFAEEFNRIIPVNNPIYQQFYCRGI